MSSDHQQEIDPVTGYETTGHEWNGIKELNTPFPRLVAWIMVLTIIYSIVAWILLPAWPIGRDYTRGLLGVDQTTDAQAEHRRIDALRQVWKARFEDADFDALAADTDLMALAMPAAKRLFADNCAACHGTNGEGRTVPGEVGFPALDDGDWLWSSAPEDIAEILRVGINSDHPDTNFAEMMAFGRDGVLSRSEIDRLARYVAALPQGQADHSSPAAELFADNCASCHGDQGSGGLGVGAPALDDAGSIYGSDLSSIRTTLMNGRAGVMPAWDGRLTQTQRNLLALYVSRLPQQGGTE